MKVQYRERALRDIERIYQYIGQRSPHGARNVVRAVYAGIQFIAAYPEASELTDDPTVRVKIVPRYGYKIFYSIVADDTIELLHIRHASRRPWEGRGDDS